jgi:hypothetical protein
MSQRKKQMSYTQKVLNWGLLTSSGARLQQHYVVAREVGGRIVGDRGTGDLFNTFGIDQDHRGDTSEVIKRNQETM